MDTSPSLKLTIFLAMFVLGSLTGCSETFMIGDRTIWPPADQVSDTFSGVTPPYERVKRLRDLADSASRMPPDQKQQTSSELADQYRQEADPLIRLEMLCTLGRFRTEPAAAVLRTAVNDVDPEIRVVACRIWGDWGGPDAARVLTETFKRDSDGDVRLAAARALGKTGDAAAVASLGEALDDPDPAMQVRAVQSLRQVTGRDLGDDVDRWRQYVKGETPAPEKPVSIADRVRGMF